MKVKELISILEDVNQESEILFKPANSDYPESFDGIIREGVNIHSFFGPDFKATVLMSGGQAGGI